MTSPFIRKMFTDGAGDVNYCEEVQLISGQWDATSARGCNMPSYDID